MGILCGQLSSINILRSRREQQLDDLITAKYKSEIDGLTK